MRSVLWLLVSIFCGSIYAADIEKNGQVQGNLKGNLNYLDCFAVFVPRINFLTTEVKESCEACVSSANSLKDREIYEVNHTRLELSTEVKRLKEALSTCSAQLDHFGYFDCLKGIVEIDKRIVMDITNKSSRYSNKIKEIEEQQISCFRNAVSKIRDAVSSAILSLQTCLTSVENLDGRDDNANLFPINIDQSTVSYFTKKWNPRH